MKKTLKEDTSEIDKLGIRSSSLLTHTRRTDEEQVLCEQSPTEVSKMSAIANDQAMSNGKRKTGSVADVKQKSTAKKRKKKNTTEFE